MTTSRRGPRPLLLHLLLAGQRRLAAQMTICATAAPSSNVGWPRSRAGQREAARIGQALAAANQPPEAFHAAVIRQLAQQDRALLDGIVAYRRQPPTVHPPAPPILFREGGSRLLDYGGTGTPVLFVPSLVNRAQVLDLLPDASMLRWLAANGARPLLLDWGAPGDMEAGFTLTDYVAGRLERALAVAAADGPVVLAGYCMGGLLALAAAQRRPERVRALVLLATPWDFWAPSPAIPRAVGGLLPAFESLLQATGTLPVDVLQTLFAMVEPFGVAAKFRAFAALDPASERARRFTAIEDWLNDGVPLAAPVAREVLGGWYGANTPARGAWRIAGAAVDPAAAPMPTWFAIPARDRLVPPAAALALAAARPGAVVHRAAGGHVGMVAGASAEAMLWRPLAGWLATLG